MNNNCWHSQNSHILLKTFDPGADSLVGSAPTYSAIAPRASRVRILLEDPAKRPKINLKKKKKFDQVSLPYSCSVHTEFLQMRLSLPEFFESQFVCRWLSLLYISELCEHNRIKHWKVNWQPNLATVCTVCSLYGSGSSFNVHLWNFSRFKT